ncbi:hypothetical protein ACN47E_002129 [Coniothyrium glycines]
MIRCALLTLGSVALRLVDPTALSFGGRIRLSYQQLATLQWYLKWGLPLWALLDFNAILNRLAANRWSLTSDKARWDWKNEVAVVTGGSGGIGACVVQQLVAHGIRVAVLDVVPLSESFTQAERKLIHYYKCDITSRDAIHEAGEAIRSDLSSPSILINNAGIGNAYTILDIPQESLKKMIDINLVSHWSTVQEFLPDMIAMKKGHIMTVASLASFVVLAGAVDYACTKAAVLAFHEGLTQELKHRYKCPDVKTTIVHPNWTKSAITSHPSLQAGLKAVGAKMLETEDVARAMTDQILAARSGQLILGPGLSSRVRAMPLWIQELVRDSQAHIVSGGGSTAAAE